MRNAPAGKEFDFTKSRSFVLPTPYEAHDLAQLAEVLKKVTIRSIDFHVFNARLRLGRGTNDFSNWINTTLGYPDLAARLDRFDPYTYTLENLRQNIIDIILQSPEWEADNAKK